MLGNPMPPGVGLASTMGNAHPATASATQAAVIQDLISRHNLSSPAHPSHMMHWRGSSSHGPGQLMHLLTNTSLHEPLVLSASMSHIELEIPKSRCNNSSALQAEAKTHQEQEVHAPNLPAQSGLEMQQQTQKLQASMPTVDVAKAVAKHPLLLSYSSATLQKHMQQLERLVGLDAAATMVAKMPQLLHYKSSTLAAKLDRLYDLLPEADVGKMVVRSPFLLGISTETLVDRFQDLQKELAGSDVQRMAEYCPSILECKLGKVVGNLKALKQMLPDEVHWSTVVQHMPSLLLSNMSKVEEKYMRMQILCMHKPRWRRDLIASQHKPATFARLLGVSHRVIDRLAFLLESTEPVELGAVTILLMSKAKFQARFDDHDRWLQHRDTARHTNAWQSRNAMDVLTSLDQQALLPSAVWS